MATVSPLAWDTEFWGRPSARVHSDAHDTPATLAATLAEAQRHHAFVQLLLPLDEVALLHAAEDAGCRIVDVRCLLDMAAPGPAPVATAPATEVTGEEADVAAVAELAAAAHTISRFASDPHLPTDRVGDFYRRWIRWDLTRTGWRLAVVRHEGGIGGYVTYGVDDEGTGAIGLIGVDAAARGLGLGARLARHAADACFRGGARRMTVVTQAGNAPAMRLYRTVGFGVAELGCWLHWHAGG